MNKQDKIVDIFSKHAEILKSLSHPKRLEIIHLLRDQSLSVTEMYKMLDLPQANLSQHLQILRSKGVVTCKKVGKQINYQVSHPNYIQACDLIREILKHSRPLTEIIPIATDPICGMKLTPLSAAHIYEHNNVINYFCASGCFKKYKQQHEH